ncbi:MAG: galactose-1-epimerase, partial [Oscillospiraceae bacterium]|nr:galactose-1-epimerase [Oscillospiraceae bacterium]
MGIGKKLFGYMPDGREVHLFVLENSKGMKTEITNFGGTIVTLYAPGRNGDFDDITLGYDKLEPYFENAPYYGSIIGRHANRIEGAVFELNGVTYRLAQNNLKNHLHGGLKGFDKMLWNPEIINRNGNECLKLSYLSRDGEENYPGNLSVD